MKSRAFAFGSALIGAALAATVDAATLSPPQVGPLPFNAGVAVRGQTIGPGFAQTRFNRVTPGDDSFSLSSEGDQLRSFGRGNQQSGAVGALAATTPGTEFRAATADAYLFDLVTFDFGGASSQQVEFSLELTGALSNSGVRSATAIGAGGVEIADVTGLTNGFFFAAAPENLEGGLLRPNSETVNTFGTFQTTDPTIVTREFGGLAVVSADLERDIRRGDFAIGVADEFIVDESGVAQALAKTLNGSFLAEAGATYALIVSATANANQAGVTADVSSTATFAFTDLGGGVFSSASGLLPGEGERIGAPVTPIPAPPALVALITAMGLLVLRTRRH